MKSMPVKIVLNDRCAFRAARYAIDRANDGRAGGYWMRRSSDASGGGSELCRLDVVLFGSVERGRLVVA